MIQGQKRILITGGAGGLGKIVSRILLKNGFKVRIFDLDNKRSRKNVKDIGPGVEIFWGDITQPGQVQAALQDIDTVIHMAAILPPWAYINAERTFKVNVGGTQNVVESIKASSRKINFIYTSSAAAFGPTPHATEPLCPDKTECKPKGAYGESKHRAESVIRGSGIDYLILRLTATMYLNFEFSDFKRMFSVPLTNRIEYCHPYDTAQAILNAVNKFDQIKGQTLIISGGPAQRMLYGDMIKEMLKVYGLPLPSARKFTKIPYYLDWYDTAKSQFLLNFQKRTFEDFLGDLSTHIRKRYSALFLPLMRYFVGPLFGKLIVNLI